VLKEEVTTVQQGLTTMQQSGFLLPQLSAFLEQPRWRKGHRWGDRVCWHSAGGAVPRGFPSFVLLLTMFGL
jgi:hypothetical protein